MHKFSSLLILCCPETTLELQPGSMGHGTSNDGDDDDEDENDNGGDGGEGGRLPKFHPLL